MAKLLTRREYADYRKEQGFAGGTYQTVCRKIKEGKISLIDGKLIDPEVSDIEWNRNTDNTRLRVDEQIALGDQRTPCQLDADSEIPEYQVSKARIEAIKAIKEQLSLDEMQGELVRVSDVFDELFDVINTMKGSLLLIPQRVAPELASLNDVTDIENALEDEITKTLAQLSVQLDRSEVIKKGDIDA